MTGSEQRSVGTFVIPFYFQRRVEALFAQQAIAASGGLDSRLHCLRQLRPRMRPRGCLSSAAQLRQLARRAPMARRK